MKLAFVMYKKLGKWLSPGVTGTQTDSAAGNDDDDNDDDGGCLLEGNSQPSSGCTVVNSHVVSLATSSSLRHRVDLAEPLTLTLSHIHVCTPSFLSYYPPA